MNEPHPLRCIRLLPRRANIFAIRGQAYYRAFLGYSRFERMGRFCRNVPSACPSPHMTDRP